MMRYACCDTHLIRGKRHFTVKMVALFQNKKDAEIFNETVSRSDKRPLDVVDVLTGEIVNDTVLSVEDVARKGISQEDALRMVSYCEQRREDVRKYFENWRKQNGIGNIEEKTA